MANALDSLLAELSASPRHWIVTGCAGFIGSHIVENLLRYGQSVTGADDLSTGSQSNLDAVQSLVSPEQWARFSFHRGDIRDLAFCQQICAKKGIVLHQAALGSVPRSIKDPLTSHTANVDGFLNMLIAARDAGVSRFVYASSSSVYGDSPKLPKVEGDEGEVLSPYAATKAINEIYAGVFAKNYGLQCIGLRYFNVFGPRQSPAGEYAAVIPRWVDAMASGVTCTIYGDGTTSRDFCYVLNAVQANLRAGVTTSEAAFGSAFNIACGDELSLAGLHAALASEVERITGRSVAPFERAAFRAGDVKHSKADISHAKRLLGFEPTHAALDGVRLTVESFLPAQ